jgi:hypothetical protein
MKDDDQLSCFCAETRRRCDRCVKIFRGYTLYVLRCRNLFTAREFAYLRVARIARKLKLAVNFNRFLFF